MTSEGRERLITMSLAVAALTVSVLSFYRTYLYTKQQLELTVTDVSYVTNQGELYMTVAFSNAGNRDAALLRVEPALWARRDKADPDWLPLDRPIADAVPLADPKIPTIVHAGGLALVSLASRLDPADAESAEASQADTAYVGLRIETMNSDGNLYLIQQPVARLTLNRGRIVGAEPAIHRSLSGFVDLSSAPPGDRLQSNRQTPFVWADQHY